MSKARRWTSAALLMLLPLVAGIGIGEENTLTIDRETSTIRLRCQVAEQGQYKQLEGRIEYVLTQEGGKAYESLLTTTVSPQALYDAMKALGMEPGHPAEDTGTSYSLPNGAGVSLFIEVSDANAAERVPLAGFVLDAGTKEPLADIPWMFTGSRRSKDPDTGEPMLAAEMTGTLIALHHRDPTVLIQNGSEKARDFRRFKPNLDVLPAVGSAVTLIVTPNKATGE